MFGIRLQAMATLAVVLLLVSCSQSPKAASKADAGSEKSPAASGQVSGKSAFWEMYKSAHAWAPDLTPLTLESKSNGPGKAETWSATFGSPRKREARTFVYSVVPHPPDTPKGVSVGRGLLWGGPTHDALPFQTADFVIDSDAAYQTALEQAGPWLKKHPDQQPSLALGNASRFNGPVWYVHWGDKESGYSVFVNAKTGAIVK